MTLVVLVRTLNDDHTRRFAMGVVAAGLATICSSPFNFVRNMAFAQSPKVEMDSFKDRAAFWHRTVSDLILGVRSHTSFFKRIKKCSPD